MSFYRLAEKNIKYRFLSKRHTCIRPILCRSFHSGRTGKADYTRNSSRGIDDIRLNERINKFSWKRNLNENRFEEFYKNEIQNSRIYSKVQPDIRLELAKKAFYFGDSSPKERLPASGLFSKLTATLLVSIVQFTLFFALLYFIFGDVNGIVSSNLETGFNKDDDEYIVESSEKRFTDVKGMDEIIDELEQVVDILTNHEKYEQMGARVPRGLLLSGKPGTGKTLIAKAVAGESNVSFLHAAGSQFDEMYVGVGAKRMRKLFSEARDNAPCIVFIDEIDAVGGKRAKNPTSDYSRMTINQLLAEMDGFNQNENIVVIGATNFKDVLDPALLRPGRFDLHVEVPLPNRQGRKEILEHYFSKVKFSENVNISKIATITAGFTGAKLENIVNQAAIRAVRKKHNVIDFSHLEYAYDKVTMGPELLTFDQSEDGQRKTAIHEGGHCLLAHILAGQGVHSRPRKATVTRRGGALGHVSFQPADGKDEESESLEELRAQLIVAMGGRAAEEIFFGELKCHTGAFSDMKMGHNIAQHLVCNASASAKGTKGLFIDYKNCGEAQRNWVDERIEEEIDVAYSKALELLQNNSEEHKLLIEAMVKYKTLDYDEIQYLLKTKSLSKLEKFRQAAESKRKSGDKPEKPDKPEKN